MSNARELAELGGSYGTGGFVGMKNRIINGACTVAQRGNVAAVLGSWTYGAADRIAVLPVGFTTATGTIFQVAGYVANNKGQAVVLTTTGSGSVNFETRLESVNVIDLNSNTVTFSVAVYHEVGSNVNVTLTITKANAVDNFSAKTTLGTSTPVSVVSATRTVLTYTLALGSTDASNGLSCQVNFTGIGAVTSKNFMTGDWQLEKGSTATSFDYRPYGTELALCQRYYTALVSGTGAVAQAQATSSSSIYGVIRFPVPMRAAPTVTVSSAGHFSIPNSGGTQFAAGGFAYSSTAVASEIDFTSITSSPLVAGNCSGVFASNGSAQLNASSEL